MHVNMAGTDAIVNKFVALWRITSVRQKLPLLFLAIAIAGSVLKSIDVVPETYFSDSKNALNVYFVKISWGWTLFLLSPFILLSNSHVDRSVTFLFRRLTSLVVATAIWYVCTETFAYIEDVTGSCVKSDSGPVEVIPGELTATPGELTAGPGEFTSKASCRRAGFHWHGYDISGHTFILAYSALVIVEEMAPMAYLKKPNVPSNIILDLLYLSLNAIVILWIWMFACTSVYFHDLSHKVLGTVCGLLGWYLTYQVWYLKPLSPGLPPQPKELKQRT